MATKTPPSILLVDDEESVLRSLTVALEEDYALYTAMTGEEALRTLGRRPVDIVLLDIRLPGISGLEALQQIKQTDPDLEVIMVTALAEVDIAVKAMKLGAYHYITKPFDVDELYLTVERALEKRRLLTQVAYLREEQKRYTGMEDIVGRSLAFRLVTELIEKVKDADSTVLIRGDSGTGKEVVARAIHARSRRAAKPFIAVNCAALPEHLIESELFGHEAGSFTGAMSRKRGKFELAHTGTLFLDEVGSMAMPLQPKLLRAIQDREIERVGSEKPLRVDVRVLAATNRDLRQMVREGKFREDLYYRLDVVEIALPPLRERKEDIPDLADYFLAKLRLRYGRDVPLVSEEAIAALQLYDWPGNVRELENILERLVVLHRDAALIEVDHLPSDIIVAARIAQGVNRPGVGAGLKEAAQQFERQMILKTLERTNWNKSRTALILGIDRNALYRRISELGIVD